VLKESGAGPASRDSIRILFSQRTKCFSVELLPLLTSETPSSHNSQMSLQSRRRVEFRAFELSVNLGLFSLQ
jgi:hypothetical protein